MLSCCGKSGTWIYHFRAHTHLLQTGSVAHAGLLSVSRNTPKADAESTLLSDRCWDGQTPAWAQPPCTSLVSPQPGFIYSKSSPGTSLVQG